MRAFNVIDPNGFIVARCGTRKAALKKLKFIGLPSFTIEPMVNRKSISEVEIMGRVVLSLVRQIQNSRENYAQ